MVPRGTALLRCTPQCIIQVTSDVYTSALMTITSAIGIVLFESPELEHAFASSAVTITNTRPKDARLIRISLWAI